ncbi:MAG: endonuclease domain-containing protein [Bacteroidales bacterium]|nr:endonuclease domain-containing protein [Bacteroidales bacterium]
MVKDLRNIGREKQSWRERIKSHVRELRRNQTESEAITWELVRNRKLDGKKFLRQHPIVYYFYKKPWYFVADFYCAEARLVIEIDGPIHKIQVDYDEQRDFILKQKGLRILRIKNEELKDINNVKNKIINALLQ